MHYSSHGCFYLTHSVELWRAKNATKKSAWLRHCSETVFRDSLFFAVDQKE